MPRKIVIDIVIGDHDSFVNSLIKKYNDLLEYMIKNKRITLDYKAISQEYAAEKTKLLARCMKRFEDNLFMKQLTLDEEIKEAFEEEIKNLLEQTVKSVEGIISSILKEKRGIKDTLGRIKLELTTYSSKKYKADVEIVSQAIANGASLTSFDSDVIYLMALYSADNAA